MASYSYTPVLMTSSSSSIVVLGPTNERAGYTTVQIEIELAMVAPTKLLNVFVTNMMKSLVHKQKSMILARVTDSPALVTAIKQLY